MAHLQNDRIQSQWETAMKNRDEKGTSRKTGSWRETGAGGVGRCTDRSTQMSKGQGGKHTNKNLTEPSWYRSRFTRNWQRTQRGDRLFNPRWSNQVMSCRWADQAAAPPNLDETNTRGHKRQGTKKAGERRAKTVHNTKNALTLVVE